MKNQFTYIKSIVKSAIVFVGLLGLPLSSVSAQLDYTVSTVAGTGDGGFMDGDSATALFRSPRGITVDDSGVLFVTDFFNHRIRRIDIDGNVSTIAGTGTSGFTDGDAATAQFSNPLGITVDDNGILFVADAGNHSIRRIDTEGNVSTIAGTGTPGFMDGDAATAQFNIPRGITVDDNGILFVADEGNHRIRRIDTDGNVSTIAGSGTPGFTDGDAATAQFNFPVGITVDDNGILFVVDLGNHSIRRIDTEGNVSTIAGSGTSGFMDGNAATAQFNFPRGITVDDNGILFVADSENHRIRRIDTDGNVTTVAGTGTFGFIDGDAATAQFRSPVGITVDDNGILFVADRNNHSIRRIDTDGNVSTIAGTGTFGFIDGDASTAQFSSPNGITVDDSGVVYIADQVNFSIRRIDTDGNVSTIAGTGTPGFIDGDAATAQFRSPLDITVDDNGMLFVTDSGNHSIRRLTPEACPNPDILITQSADTTITSENGQTDTIFIALSQAPTSDVVVTLSIDDASEGSIPTEDLTFTSANWDTHQLVIITGEDDEELDGSVSYMLTAFVVDASSDDAFDGVSATTIVTNLDDEETCYTVSTVAGTGDEGFMDGDAATAQFNLPFGITVDDSGVVYIADQFNHRIRRIDTDGNVSTIAGSGTPGFTDGDAATAQFNFPVGITVDDNGILFVVDLGNHSIRRIDTEGNVSTIAGSGTSGFMDGNAATAQFNFPRGITVDDNGILFVADSENHRIRRIDTDGNVTTVAGTGTFGFIDGDAATAQFRSPVGITVDDNGILFVADRNNHSIRRIDTDGNVSTIAGTGTFGFIDGDASTAQFSSPNGITVDDSGVVYIADQVNFSIRRIDTDGNVSTIAGTGTPGFIDGDAATAQFRSPLDITVDDNGMLFVTDSGNHSIRRLTPEACPNPDILITQSADTTITSENGQTDTIFIALSQAPTSDVVVTLSIDDASEGSIPTEDLTFTSANWDTHQLVIITGEDDEELDGSVSYMLTAFVVDASSDDAFDGVSATTIVTNLDDEETCYTVSTVAGTGDGGFMDGNAATAQFNFPFGITVDDSGVVYIADLINHRIRRIDTDGNVSTIAGTGTPGFIDGDAATAQFNAPVGITVDDNGILFVTDFSNHSIRRIDTDGNVSTITGTGTPGFIDGDAATAQFNLPFGITVDDSGILFVADSENHRIRRIDTDGNVSTLAGTGTPGFTNGDTATAQFNAPGGITVDDNGILFVADQRNHNIRRIDTDGNVSTLAGTGASGFTDGDAATAQFNFPTGITVDDNGILFVTDVSNQSIRRIDTDGNVSTLAGTGASGFTDGDAATAQFNSPVGITVDDSGVVYIADQSNHSIRRLTSEACPNLDILITQSADTTITSEDGQTDTIFVALSQAPTSDVVVAISIDDNTEGSISTDTLTFTSGNWDAQQSVIITGIDDEERDGDITYMLTAAVVDESSDDAFDDKSMMISITNEDDGEPCLGNIPVISSIDVVHSIICGVAATGEISISIQQGDQDNIEYSIDDGITWTSDSVFTDLDAGIYQVLARFNDDMITCPIEEAMPTEIRCIIDLDDDFTNTALTEPLITGPSVICEGETALFSFRDSMLMCVPVMIFDSAFMEIVEVDSCYLGPVVEDAVSHTWFSSSAAGTEVLDMPSSDFDVSHSTQEDSTVITIFITDSNGDIFNAQKVLYFLSDTECAAFRCQQNVFVSRNQLINNQAPSLVTAQQTISSDGLVRFNTTSHFRAGLSIEMLADFEIRLGGSFLAEIAGCEPDEPPTE